MAEPQRVLVAGPAGRLEGLFRLDDIPSEVPPQVVIPFGLTKDEYWDALNRVVEKRNEERYAEYDEEDWPPEYAARRAAIEALGPEIEKAERER